MARPAVNFEALSVEERLKLLEQVWESLSQKPENVPITEAQRAELDRRLDELKREGVTGIPWDEVLRQIRQRTK